MTRPTAPKVLFALVLALGLAACQSAEERAEGYYQSALSLMAEGDADRALVELRNVFDLDGSHREARTLYATTLLEQGETTQAYGQFLRLVEQYPDDLPALLALSRTAIERQDWAELRRHGNRARALDPDDPEVQAVAVNIDYADALDAEDAPARRDVARRAAALSETRPEDMQLFRILADSALRDGELETALGYVDEALLLAPTDRGILNTRTSLLNQLGRADEVLEMMRKMVTLFPEDETLLPTLVRLYAARDDLDGAEAYLRDRLENADDAIRDGARDQLVAFLLEARGTDAALAELDGALAAEGSDPALRSLRARILFNAGEAEAAVAEMESLLEEAGAGRRADEDRIVLAQMLRETGNVVGAQRLVAQVLEADSTQVGALKMEANWRIEADETDAAISLLRTALDGAPQDVEAMTLMAQAHLRNGDRDLARDLLSLAMQASGTAPTETRRYAALLIEAERYLLAEEVLIDALRGAPSEMSLLIDLGDVYIRLEDWSRAAQVEAQLRRSGQDDAARAADGLQARRLAAEGRTDEAISFLEDVAAENGGDVAVQVAVMRARLADGDAAGALAYADEVLAEEPDNLVMRFARTTALAAMDDLAGAEAGYRAILAENDQFENAWVALLRVLNLQGAERAEEARAVLAEGLEAMPEALNLLWAQASFLEQTGDLDGALEIYERLYERAPDQPVVVNNLASLLSTHRQDEAALERAAMVARRLRDMPQAPFQDTYGWIAYRQGDYGTALDYLEPAAAVLRADPMAQYHLGATYQALGRDTDALAQLRRAVELAEDDPRPQFDDARSRIDALEAAVEADPPAPGE